MTRFVGEAIGSRPGRGKGTSSKDLKKDMETFKETGIHPALQQRQPSQAKAPPLPEQVQTRPYVYFQLSIDRKDVGRLVIECFEDVAPLAVATFLGRLCSFQGPIHRLIRGYAAFGGRASSQREPVQVKRYSELCHVEPGVISLSLDGTEFAICMAETCCGVLDETHQVVGRICSGIEVLDQLNKVPTDSDDHPRKSVVLSDCGLCDAKGKAATTAAGAGEKDFAETAAEARAAIK